MNNVSIIKTGRIYSKAKKKKKRNDYYSPRTSKLLRSLLCWTELIFLTLKLRLLSRDTKFILLNLKFQNDLFKKQYPRSWYVGEFIPQFQRCGMGHHKIALSK